MEKDGAREGAANGSDVTIILVSKYTIDEAHTKKKSKRTCMDQSDGTAIDTSHGAAPEQDKILMESSRLRHCSKYFATCMSGRWTRQDSSPSPMEFRLELQTEPRYYHDCFSRMNHPFLKAIPNITHCIHLLKVASQIEYHELMDICVKYLSAAPWTINDENQLREFCTLGHLSSDSTTDLCARLRFPLTEEARQKETSTLIQRMLSGYLKIALTQDSTFELFDSRYASREVFAGAFHALVSCKESSKMCHDALRYALAVATEELEKVLVSMAASGSQKGWDSYPCVVTGNLLRFCWLFEVLREANAAQVVVERLLKHDVSRILLSAFDPYVTTAPPRAEITYQWAKMMYFIFQDVLAGRLFLKTSDRFELFQRWNWVLKKVDHLAPEEPPVSEIVATFVTSFPHQQQEEIFLRWARDLDEYSLQVDYNLTDAHTMWMMSLVSPSEAPKVAKKVVATSQIEYAVDGTVEHKVEIPTIRSSWFNSWTLER